MAKRSKRRKRPGGSGREVGPGQPTADGGSKTAGNRRRNERTRPPGRPEAASTGRFAIGLGLLLAATGTTLVLVLHHIAGLSLPGCGPGGGCAALTSGPWGKVPLTEWPVSFVGFSYFSALLVVWAGFRGAPAVPLRYPVRLGGLVSLMFLGVMVWKQQLCAYCLGTHVANLAFWALLETAPARANARPRLGRMAAVTLGVFVVISIGLGFAERSEKQRVEKTQEGELEESIAEIIQSTDRQAEADRAARSSETGGADGTADASGRRTNDSASSSGEDQGSAPVSASAADIKPPWTGPFTGRYRLGPEKAQVRIVMYTDYQCVDCLRVEPDVMALVAQNDNVSLSVKHFPMDASCNRFMSQSLHPNACWAARAAEAAGVLRGNDGFWEMHRWLFEHKGAFTNDVLNEGLLEMGYDPATFTRVMAGPETEQRVKADIEEGQWLGLHFTPMVFINGVQLRGIFVPKAVSRAVEALLAEHPPALTAEADHPVPALEKYITDWEESVVRRMPPDPHRWSIGPDDAKVRIIMWAEYQEPYSAQADRAIRDWIASRDDVQYTFRHYPFDQSCNPAVNVTFHPLACRASAAAEAAGALRGPDGYWKMHVWLMEHQNEFSDDALRKAAPGLGFDPDALFQKMEEPEVATAIREDAVATKSGIDMLYRRGIPTIYVNDKVIPRWRMRDKPIVDKILDRAYAEAAER